MRLNKRKKLLYTCCFLLLTCLILTNSQKSMYYAMNGLQLWYTKMIPALLPFMILSGIMIRLRLTEGFASILHPVVGPVYRVQKNVTYAMIMGFLCGFPMGARVTCDLLDRKLINNKEAGFLLAFCNNIGPVYFIGFVLPLLNRSLVFPYLIGMYGLPLIYGLILRYTVYSDLQSDSVQTSGMELSAASYNSFSLLEQIDEAVASGIQSILKLGGYMIFFNLLQLGPDCLVASLTSFDSLPCSLITFLNKIPALLAPVFEITGGLGILGERLPLCSLLLLSFGGLSCVAQTYSIIKDSELSIHSYVTHKLALTVITAIYYAGWKLVFPNSFLL